MEELRSLIPILIVQTCCIALAQAQGPSMVGKWEVKIIFENGDNRSMQFEAADAGRGSLQLVDPRSDAAQSHAKWIQSDGNSVIFSGPVEFPIGNVGRSQGTLVFKGKFEKGDSITGEVAFFTVEVDPNNPKATPSKRGTFKASRAVDKKNSTGYLTPELQPGSEAAMKTHGVSLHKFIRASVSISWDAKQRFFPVPLSSFFSMSVGKT